VLEAELSRARRIAPRESFQKRNGWCGACGRLDAGPPPRGTSRPKTPPDVGNWARIQAVYFCLNFLSTFSPENVCLVREQCSPLSWGLYGVMVWHCGGAEVNQSKRTLNKSRGLSHDPFKRQISRPKRRTKSRRKGEDTYVQNANSINLRHDRFNGHRGQSKPARAHVSHGCQ